MCHGQWLHGWGLKAQREVLVCFESRALHTTSEPGRRLRLNTKYRVVCVGAVRRTSEGLRKDGGVEGEGGGVKGSWRAGQQPR